MDSQSARRTSILLMLICSTLWSIAGIFIKMVPWNPLVIGGARSLIASFIVAAYMLVAKVPFRFNKGSILAGALLSVTFLSFVSANKLTTSANAVVLQFTAPVFIVLISTFVLKHRYRQIDYLVVVITMLGIALCFLDQLGPGNMAGNVVGVFSGLLMGSMYVATGRIDPASRMTSIFLGQLFTAAVGLSFVFVYPTPISTKAVVSIVILGVFQLGIPYVLYGIAVKNCPPLVCSLVSAVEPLLNPIWVFLFDGEAPGVFALTGGAVVIGTVTAWCIWSDRQAAAQRALASQNPSPL